MTKLSTDTGERQRAKPSGPARALASTGRMDSRTPILFTNTRRVLGNQGRPCIEVGLVAEAAPGSPDHEGQHFRRTQHRCPSSWITRQVFGLQVRLQGFEIIINGHLQLEQSFRTTSLLLDENGALLGRAPVQTWRGSDIRGL